ncbi:MAG: pyrrolo-quinoline quinone, partial [Candidatus Korobacteraceae bacterium]
MTVLLFLCLGLLCWGSTVFAADSATPAASPATTPAASPNKPPLTIPYPTDVLTYHYNVFRQGYTSQETTLTTSNVNFNTFGKINFFTVDG